MIGGAVALGGLTWPELPERPLVLVPLGATEQHGPHLSVTTDTLIADAVTRRVIAALNGRVGRPVVLAPALPFGASGEHEGFPGTISIGHDALEHVLVELVRSLAHWAGPIVIVNAHGGNEPTLGNTIARMRAEGHAVSAVSLDAAGTVDSHAGHHETSLMWALVASGEVPAVAVRGDRVECGRCEPLAVLLPQLREHGVRAVSPSGVLGDPCGATADDGERLLGMLVEAVVHSLATEATMARAGSHG